MTDYHILGDSYKRFDPHISIAQSWQRLSDKNMEIQKHDITLIKHELMELKLVEIDNMYEKYGLRTELLKSKKFYQNTFDTAVNYEALMDLKKELML